MPFIIFTAFQATVGLAITNVYALKSEDEISIFSASRLTKTNVYPECPGWKRKCMHGRRVDGNNPCLLQEILQLNGPLKNTEDLKNPQNPGRFHYVMGSIYKYLICDQRPQTLQYHDQSEYQSGNHQYESGNNS